MSKPYLSIPDQVKNLTSRKGLIIDDIPYAQRILADIGYFSLIGGYKTPFINPMTRKYINNANFDDILALYQFDKNLRLLTFGCLNTIEEKIRTLISDAFCFHFGEKQTAYLDSANYQQGKKYSKDVSDLINKHLSKAVNDRNHPYIVHQRTIYDNVPLWVTSKVLTFGNLSKMYSILQIQQRRHISNLLPNISEQELARSLSCLTFFRNVCAHNERLYCFRLTQHAFPDTILHKKMHIPMKGTEYVMGKRDYFAVIIWFKYLLPKEEFLIFKSELKKLILSYTKKNSQISENELLKMMSMPLNWETISKYKI